MNGLLRPSRAFGRTQLRQSGRIAHSREEHDGILTAMAQGNGDEASRRMRAHMLNAASALGHYIRASGIDTAALGERLSHRERAPKTIKGIRGPANLPQSGK